MGRRTIFDGSPDPVQLLAELYRDVTRNQDRLPLGNLTRHTLKRLGQSYTALALIEAARRGDLMSPITAVRPTRAMVQDKRTSQEFPAAHALPCDLEFATPAGARRLPDFFTNALNRGWIERNVFAPTDRVHRLANLADQWLEDAGAKRTLAEAAAKVIAGRSAADAFHEVLEPGYARAIDQALGKVERNLTYFERQAIFRSRIAQADGSPARSAPSPGDLLLKAQQLDARAATKESLRTILIAYAQHSSLGRARERHIEGLVDAIDRNERLMDVPPTAPPSWLGAAP